MVFRISSPSAVAWRALKGSLKKLARSFCYWLGCLPPVFAELSASLHKLGNLLFPPSPFPWGGPLLGEDFSKPGVLVICFCRHSRCCVVRPVRPNFHPASRRACGLFFPCVFRSYGECPSCERLVGWVTSRPLLVRSSLLPSSLSWPSSSLPWTQTALFTVVTGVSRSSANVQVDGISCLALLPVAPPPVAKHYIKTNMRPQEMEGE